MAKKKTSSSLTDPVAREIANRFRALMPTNDQVTGDALREVIGAHHGDIESLKAGASRVIQDAERRAYEIYLEAEGPAATAAIEQTFTPLLAPGAMGLDGVRLVANHAAALNSFYLSVSQSRKSRAGSALETFFNSLFRALRYKFEREHAVNGTPDFVFPSAAHFHHLSTDCIVFTSKRTLRERWRQITTEGSRGFLLFLGTLDKTVKANDLGQMKDQKIYVVVPEEIRAAHYATQPHVLSVEKFLTDYLDPAMDRWRRNGVLSVDNDLFNV